MIGLAAASFSKTSLQSPPPRLRNRWLVYVRNGRILTRRRVTGEGYVSVLRGASGNVELYSTRAHISHGFEDHQVCDSVSFCVCLQSTCSARWRCARKVVSLSIQRSVNQCTFCYEPTRRRLSAPIRRKVMRSKTVLYLVSFVESIHMIYFCTSLIWCIIKVVL